jgi:hypothetical protein
VPVFREAAKCLEHEALVFGRRIHQQIKIVGESGITGLDDAVNYAGKGVSFAFPECHAGFGSG